LFIVGSGEEQHHRDANKRLMQIVQDLMRSEDGIALSNAGKEYDGVRRRMLLDLLDNHTVVVIDLH